jgi:hypothetical protein
MEGKLPYLQGKPPYSDGNTAVLQKKYCRTSKEILPYFKRKKSPHLIANK